MESKQMVTSSFTGFFNAKIQGRPDFIANYLSIYDDGENYHCIGRENTDDIGEFTLLYLTVKHNPLPYEFAILFVAFRSGSGNENIETRTCESFDFNFDAQTQCYKGSFHIPEDKEERIRDILGRFEITTRNVKHSLGD